MPGSPEVKNRVNEEKALRSERVDASSAGADENLAESDDDDFQELTLCDLSQRREKVSEQRQKERDGRKKRSEAKRETVKVRKHDSPCNWKSRARMFAPVDPSSNGVKISSRSVT